MDTGDLRVSSALMLFRKCDPRGSGHGSSAVDIVMVISLLMVMVA
jgi:hypothetical protein